MSVLRRHLALAAQLIPQIYHLVKLSLALETTPGLNEIPSDGNGGTSGSPPTQAGLSTASSSLVNNRTGTRPRKHDRESDQNDDQGNGSPKRSKSSPPDGSDGQYSFACHFHKRYPRRYNPHIDRKYLYCICPLKAPELRRIKYFPPKVVYF